MVIDCIAPGRAGHAARKEARMLYTMPWDDISWIRNYQFDKISRC